MARVRHQFYEGDFVYYVNECALQFGIVTKYFLSQANEPRYVVNNIILSEDKVYATRLEAEAKIDANITKYDEMFKS